MVPLGCDEATGTGDDGGSSGADSGARTDGSADVDSGGTDGGGSDGGGSGDSDAGPIVACVDERPAGAIIASRVAPGYDGTNASDCFINALTEAEEGDTVIVDYVPGSDGVWNIERMYPSWFDGNSGAHQVADNVTVIFEEGVTLRAMTETYDDQLGMLFRLEDVTGWRIFGYGARFEFSQVGLGDGEFRHNIALYDCHDIRIEGLVVDGSGGDGIAVTTRTATGFSEDIVLRNMQFLNHRRQGATLVSVRNFVADNVKFNSTSYRPPNSGIDFEPNEETQRLENITFTNTELAYNDYTGILFAFSHQSGSSVDYDITLNDTYIHDNWQVEGDEHEYTRAAIVMGNAGGSTEASSNQGHITFNRLYIRDEEYSGLYTVKHGLSYQLNFNDWVISNVGNRNYADDRFPIFTNRYRYDSTLPPQGRLAIDGLLVVEDRTVPFFRLAGTSVDNWSINDMTIANARIVTPYTGPGVDNVQRRPEGPGTSFDIFQGPTAPATTLSLTAAASSVTRGSSAEFTVVRASTDVAYPLAVEYDIGGTATNFDDYDGLHGFVIIPANETTASIPIRARLRCGDSESVTVTLTDTDIYALGAVTSATITITGNR